ncbi:hypothetical protein [Peribacillus deserti]|uniref:Uncharacterized protein n=1 Tax=Peribacillus deserti TaxID=673318 RepID=A0A2N5M0B9_9BACI|nr:hypothetical protein [Peribacillus deserti]PLT27816.1 hypothetical protein CUU66_21905 [Peribacillus deserti]
MKKLGLISVVISIISIYGYANWFFNENSFSGGVWICMAIILPMIGLIAAFLSKRGVLKVAGIIGNFFVLLFSVILPALAMLFWNQP